jgi:hypothetical protein
LWQGSDAHELIRVLLKIVQDLQHRRIVEHRLLDSLAAGPLGNIRCGIGNIQRGRFLRYFSV